MKKKRYNVVGKSLVAPAKLAKRGAAGPTNLVGDVTKGVTGFGKWMKGR